MNTHNAIRRLTTTLAATLLIGASVPAQIASAPYLPALAAPQSFGDALLADPVDVAVMSWCGGISWAYVADAGFNKIVRWVITPTGSPVVPSDFGAFSFGPWGVAVNDLPGHDSQEFVYATGNDLLGTSVVNVYTRFGVLVNTFEGDPAEPFISPKGIAIGPQGNVYVADEGRRKVYEFDPVFVDAVPFAPAVGTYLSCIGVVPFDVSVDLMRRVHVAGNQLLPFANGISEIYQHGAVCATTTYGSFGSTGIDAKSLCRSLNAMDDATVLTRNWTNTFFPTWSLSSPTTQGISISTPAAGPDLGGLETARTWRIAGWISGDKIVRCDRRTYVTDRDDGEVQILKSKKTSTPRPADAVAWWKLDETGSTTTAKDTLNNRHGTWTGPGLERTEGVVRCGMTFDGGTAGLSVPTHSILEVGLSDFSLEGWLRAEDQGGLRVFFDNRSGTGVGYRASIVNGQPTFFMFDGATSQTTTSPTPIDDGKWHHVAITVTRGVDTRIYVDGDLVETGASGAVIGSLSSGATLYLGRNNTGSSGLIGDLDEVTLYHRALTSIEISAIDFAECAGKHIPPTTIVDTISVGISGSGFLELQSSAPGGSPLRTYEL